MKHLIASLNKAFDNKTRLGIMSLLMIQDGVDYNDMKNDLGVTDGNLASHIKYLEKDELIRIEKSFKGKKPNTKYYATEKGKTTFKKHIEILEKIIKGE